MEYKEIKGSSEISYKFVKIGEANPHNKALDSTFNGKKLDDWTYKLRLLVNEKEFLKAEQSCYLIFEDETLVYVGYYSTSFENRWWRKDGYFWHGEAVDNFVKNTLINNPKKSITVWISVDPYAIRDNIRVNISKFIEDDIIMAADKSKLLNRVGKNLKEQKHGTRAVSDILNIH